jgi:hypothetical protein
MNLALNRNPRKKKTVPPSCNPKNRSLLPKNPRREPPAIGRLHGIRYLDQMVRLHNGPHGVGLRPQAKRPFMTLELTLKRPSFLSTSPSEAPAPGTPR